MKKKNHIFIVIFPFFSFVSGETLCLKYERNIFLYPDGERWCPFYDEYRGKRCPMDTIGDEGAEREICKRDMRCSVSAIPCMHE